MVDSEPRARLSAYFWFKPCVALVALMVVAWVFVEGFNLRTKLAETVWSRGSHLVIVHHAETHIGVLVGLWSSLGLEYYLIRLL